MIIEKQIPVTIAANTKNTGWVQMIYTYSRSPSEVIRAWATHTLKNSTYRPKKCWGMVRRSGLSSSRMRVFSSTAQNSAPTHWASTV